ncbi:unnamed protein product [Oreochromis niloticus]|nr:unnamed protein product [Mustela putorius furo]
MGLLSLIPTVDRLMETVCLYPTARVEAGQRRVLDEATRQRRLTRQLEALEKDNFQDDPLSSLPQVLLPAYLPSVSLKNQQKVLQRGIWSNSGFIILPNDTLVFKLEELRPLQAEFQEELHHTAGGGELPVSGSPPFSLTAHHFCCVCGFPSHYTCTTCGGRYCSTKCLCTHRETRCLKWTL